VLKLDRLEIRHSNMLAWLLNPHESHGLEDKLLKKFLIQASSGNKIGIMKGLTPVDVEVMNFDDVVVYREKDNIDILIVSEKNQLVVAFENKIDSDERKDQLESYKKRLLEAYKDYQLVLIYLTPNGKESSDSENWVNIDYGFVLEKVEELVKIYKIKIPEKAQLYIKDYTETIRRSVVEDNKEIEKICQKIYTQHRSALDLIFEYKLDLCRHISDYIFNYLKDNEDNFQIDVWESHYKNGVCFTPKALSVKCAKMGAGWWYKQDKLIGFEIIIGEDKVKLCVMIGPAKDEYKEMRQKIFDIAKEHKYQMQIKQLTNTYKAIKTKVFLEKDELEKLQKEYQFDDESFEKLRKEIHGFIEKDMSGIVNVLLEAFN